MPYFSVICARADRNTLMITKRASLNVILGSDPGLGSKQAGSAGRESKGLYRVHQFTKVEMFAFTTPEQSDAMHEELLRIEERIFQALEIPYRVVDIATILREAMSEREGDAK